MEHTIMLGGIIILEVCFHKLDKLSERARGRLGSVKHGALVLWLLHPAIIDGLDKWTEHLLSGVIAQFIR